MSRSRSSGRIHPPHARGHGQYPRDLGHHQCGPGRGGAVAPADSGPRRERALAHHGARRHGALRVRQDAAWPAGYVAALPVMTSCVAAYMFLNGMLACTCRLSLVCI